MDHNTAHLGDEDTTGHYNFPDPSGHFGPYGGSFVSETLTHALEELKETYARYI
ncbi:MAG: hypothetical protein RL717_2491, partial [Pseudomonadota bacterium]